MNESNEDLKRGANTEAFLSNPKKIAEELGRALKSGLASEFVEEHLAPLIDEARHVNKINNEARQVETTIEIDRLRNSLLVQLQRIEKDNMHELKIILESFCDEQGLTLHPFEHDAVRVEANLVPDWISENGDWAVKVKLDTIWTYYKMGENWLPSILNNS